jgi:hypothetical protein
MLWDSELGRKNQRLIDVFDEEFINRDIGCRLVDICTVQSCQLVVLDFKFVANEATIFTTAVRKGIVG